MLKFILPLALLALTACVAPAPLPYQGGYTGASPQPDEYDLPSHCGYNAYNEIVCSQ